jgi:hypothetical protein
MPQDYEVESGDCMSSIAFANGFFWKTLWNDGSNAALKAKRKNPNVLMPGDIVHIPDLTIKQVPGATEARHKFLLKGVPEVFKLRLLDNDRKPRANLDYIIVIEGNSRRGKTDASGRIVESIPPNARTGQLIIPPSPPQSGQPRPRKPKKHVINLQLGSLNPISEVSGLKARLANLGYYRGPIDENLDPDTQRAISAFQAKQGLPVTGVADNATQAQLQKNHGH